MKSPVVLRCSRTSVFSVLCFVSGLAGCSQDKASARKDAGTDAPSMQPTSTPTSSSTGMPTSMPTSTPTGMPTGMPTSMPTDAPTSTPTSMPTVATDAPAPPPMKDFCSLPGSIVFDASGRHVVGGDTGQLPWLTLQKGYCAHHFAKITSTREIRFGPKGELFAASPGRTCVGGAGVGLGAIVMVPDDDGDGVGDAPIPIVKVETAHGFTFAPGYIYYQATVSQIRKVAYDGGRTAIDSPATAGDVVADITQYQSSAHWGKTMDIADDGTVYVTNGGDQGTTCVQPTPFQGGILRIDGSPNAHVVASGFRNAIRLRCQKGHNHCFALELGRDSSATYGGREKLILVRDGDDWGHPCCASKNVPFTDVSPVPDCSNVAGEDNSFVIGSTPFGFDFVPMNWPAPYAGGVVVALHGVFGTWTGARVVMIGGDPTTGMPMASSTMNPMPTGPITDFVTGWDDMTQSHGRPTVATFGPDGRLYVGDDTAGEIFWVAPVVTK